MSLSLSLELGHSLHVGRVSIWFIYISVTSEVQHLYLTYQSSKTIFSLHASNERTSEFFNSDYTLQFYILLFSILISHSFKIPKFSLLWHHHYCCCFIQSIHFASMFTYALVWLFLLIAFASLLHYLFFLYGFFSEGLLIVKCFQSLSENVFFCLTFVFCYHQFRMCWHEFLPFQPVWG